jgi:hypothetical protein
MDWATGRSRFDPRQRRKDFSSSLCVQTGYGVHRASCTIGTGGLSPGVKPARGVTLTTHFHLVPRPGVSRSCIFSPLTVCMAVAEHLYFYCFFYRYQSTTTTAAITYVGSITHCEPWPFWRHFIFLDLLRQYGTTPFMPVYRTTPPPIQSSSRVIAQAVVADFSTRTSYKCRWLWFNRMDKNTDRVLLYRRVGRIQRNMKDVQI